LGNCWGAFDSGRQTLHHSGKLSGVNKRDLGQAKKCIVADQLGIVLCWRL
jgi:hypothetical protein